MVEDIVVKAILADLEIGVIQLWQVSSKLEQRGIYSFDNERLTKQIKDKYEKEHPCY